MPALSVSELTQQQADLLDEAKEINDLTLDPDTELTDEEIKDYEDRAEAKMAEAEAMQPKIDRAKKLEDKLNKGRKGKEKEVQKGDVADSVDWSRPKNVKYHTIKNFRKENVGGMSQEERAYRFGVMYLGAAARTNPGLFGHLAKYEAMHTERFGPFMAATEGGNAGVFVADEFTSDIIINVEKFGIVRDLFEIVQMSSDVHRGPKQGSDPTPVFVGEGAAGSDNTPTDDSQVTLTAKKLMAILLYSSELNEDAIINFADNMLTRTGRAFANKEDAAGFNGDGTSTHGGIKGIRTVLQDVDGAGTDSAGLVTGTGSASWTALTLADFETVVGRAPDLENGEPEDNPNAVWVTHRRFFYEVMVRLMLASGGVTAMEIEGRRRPSFMGWPVRFSNVFPTTAAASSVVATFGGHDMAARFGDRRAFSVLFSEHGTVGSVNLFETDQIGIRVTERFDIAVHSVGNSTDAGPVVGLETGA